MRRRLTSKNHLTSDGEKDNSRMFKSEKKSYFWEKSEFRVIIYSPYTKNNNSESASFTGLLKSLLALWVLEETRQNLAYVFELKAFNWLTQKDSELSFFSIGQKTITQNLEFSLPSMIPYVFRVIVSQYKAKNDNSELGIFTSSMIPCVTKFPSYRFLRRAKNDNSEFTWERIRDFWVFREIRVIAMAKKPGWNRVHPILPRFFNTCWSYLL